MAIRISQVNALDSPRKLDQFRCAFRKQSCVSVSARSTSRVEASKKRKICARWLATTPANSCESMASAVALIIGSSVVQDAITLVDGCTRSGITGPKTFPCAMKDLCTKDAITQEFVAVAG